MTESPTPLLAIDGMETCYGAVQALFGVNLEVHAGEMVALVGRNGMGKTTTVRSIMGLTPARSGRIRFEGTDIRRWPSHRIARLGIGLVPEGRQIFPTLTVQENLIATARSDVARNGDAWRLEAVYELFPPLAGRRGLPGCQLSGGEQQMLAIGRALLTQPRLLILDEATEGLAPLVRRQIWRRLAEPKAAGLTILVIDKNVDALADICDRLHVIEKGRTVWSGSGAALKTGAEIRRRHLGV